MDVCNLSGEDVDRGGEGVILFNLIFFVLYGVYSIQMNQSELLEEKAMRGRFR
jgi:hypothetical protein